MKIGIDTCGGIIFGRRVPEPDLKELVCTLVVEFLVRTMVVQTRVLNDFWVWKMWWKSIFEEGLVQQVAERNLLDKRWCGEWLAGDDPPEPARLLVHVPLKFLIFLV